MGVGNDMKIKMLANNIMKLTVSTKSTFLFGLFLLIVSGCVFIREINNFKDCIFLIPPLVGLIMMFCFSKVEVIFDKSRGILIYRMKKIFNTKEEQFHLSQVDKIIIECISLDNNIYRLVSLMKKGWSVPVTSNYSTESNYYSAKWAACEINEFLIADIILGSVAKPTDSL